MLIIRPQPKPPELKMIHLSVVGKTKHVIFKVKTWDSSLHPKGAKGLFIETPDKMKAGNLNPGDAVVTKSGKTFQVEKQTAKGVKVNPVDQATGEVQETYTVLGNDVQVAVVDAAKAVGSTHSVVDLDVGTFIQTAKGKRFQISKHGKWTTVYPVDDTGKPSGKHTVLPPATKVTIVASDVTADPGSHDVQKAVKQVVADLDAEKGFDVFSNDLALEFFKQELVDHMGTTEMEPEDLTNVIAEAFSSTFKLPGWKPTKESVVANVVGTVEEYWNPMDSDDQKALLEAWDEAIAETQKVFAEDVVKKPVAFDVWSNDLAAESFKANLAEKLAELTGLPLDDTTIPSDVGNPDKYMVASYIGDLVEEQGGTLQPTAIIHQVYDEVWAATQVEFADDVIQKADKTTLLRQGLLGWIKASDAAPFQEYEALAAEIEKNMLTDADLTLPESWTNAYKLTYMASFDEGMAASLQDYLENVLQNAGVLEPEQLTDAQVVGDDLLLHALHVKLAELIGLENSSVSDFESAADLMYGVTDVSQFRDFWDSTPWSIKDIDAMWDEAMQSVKDEESAPKPPTEEEIQTPEFFLALGERFWDTLDSTWYENLNENHVTKHEFVAGVQEELMFEAVTPQQYPVMPKVATEADFVALAANYHVEEWEAMKVWEEVHAEYEFQAAAKASESQVTVTPHEVQTPEFYVDLAEALSAAAPPIYDGTTVANNMASDLMVHDTEEDSWVEVNYFATYASNWEVSEEVAYELWKQVYAIHEMLLKEQKVASKKHEAEKVQEILPSILPKVPKLYPPGAGQDTRILIEHADRARLSDQMSNHFSIYRVSPDGTRVHLGSKTNKTAAYKEARAQSAPHEPIEHTEIIQAKVPKSDDFPTGSYVQVKEKVFVVQDQATEETKSAYSAYTHTTHTLLLAEVDPSTGLPLYPDVTPMWESIGSYSAHYVPMEGPIPERGRWTPEELRAKRKELGITTEDEKVVREARPNKWIPQLQADWELDTLVGSTVNESLKTLGKVGYREIKPRQKDAVRMVNANGKRLTLARTGTAITGVFEDKMTVASRTTGTELQAQLAETLATGGGIEALDPHGVGVPLVQRTSHVQSLLYDMAVGKQNKVAEKIGKDPSKVKSDVEYRQELLDEGEGLSLEEIASLTMGADSEPLFGKGELLFKKAAVRAKARGGIMENLGMKGHPDWDYPDRTFQIPDHLTTDEAAALVAVIRRPGVADQVLGTNNLGIEGFKADPRLNPDDVARVEVGDTVWRPDPETGEPPYTAHQVTEVKKNEVGNTVSFELESGTYDNNDTSYVKLYPPESNKAMEGAKLLAVAAVDGFKDYDVTPDSAMYMMGALLSAKEEIEASRNAAEVEYQQRLENYQTQFLQDKIDQRRKKEGTVKSVTSTFDLPVWDEIQMEPQTFEDIDQQVAIVEGIPANDDSPDPQVGDIYSDDESDWAYRISAELDTIPPAPGAEPTPHYTVEWVVGDSTAEGGWAGSNAASQVVTLQGLGERIYRPPVSVPILADVPAFYAAGFLEDGVLHHKRDQTMGRVPLEGDEAVTAVIQALGAESKTVVDPINPGYPGSATLYDGVSFQVTEGGTKEEDLVFDDDSEMETRARVRKVFEDNGVAHSLVATLISIESIVQTYPDTYKDELFQFIQKAYPNQYETIWNGLFWSGGRTIEYIPHQQSSSNAGGAPTSQRGRIILRGYTPKEAAERLQELGIVGELEPEVPFQAVLRGPRRHGAVAPILPAYVRGEAPLPKIPARVTHGLTGGATLENLNAILDSGGLLSITERHRVGIKVQSTSPNGDIRSGIDHGVFCTLDGGGACGSGSSYRIITKPSTFLRRDIVLAPGDFGGADTRYAAYRNYLNKLQAKVGEKKTNIYEPISPAVRQEHLDTVNVTSSSEHNLAPSVPIEDMEYIGAPAHEVAAIELKLDQMLAEGKIASRPKVVPNVETSALSKKGTNADGTVE